MYVSRATIRKFFITTHTFLSGDIVAYTRRIFRTVNVHTAVSCHDADLALRRTVAKKKSQG